MKPLLIAKELECMKTFSNDNLTLLPKLISSNVEINYISSSYQGFESSDSEARLVANPIRDDHFQGKITSVRVITGKEALKPTYLAEFTIENSPDEFKYQPGDSFGFYPELSSSEVNWLLERYQLRFDQPLELIGLDSFLQDFTTQKSSGKIIIKAGNLIKRLDIRGFPKKATLRTFAEFCENPEHMAELLFLSSRNGSEAYNRLRCEMFSIHTLLSYFTSCKPPLAMLVTLSGALQPRYYSCCNLQSDSEDKFKFRFVFNVTETILSSDSDIKIKGACTGWFERMIQDESICNRTFFIQQRSISHFRLPSEITMRPIIMICAGTGVAPFIGFLDLLKSLPLEKIPFVWLIFGFRTLTDDYIFKEKLDSFVSLGVISRLSLAISRDVSAPKQYVQDIIYSESGEFSRLMQTDDGLCYICGDELTMIKGVNDAIASSIKGSNPEWSSKEIDAILLNWTREKKILRDIWV